MSKSLIYTLATRTATALATAAVAVLAACGGGDDGASSPTATATPAATAAPTVGPTASPTPLTSDEPTPTAVPTSSPVIPAVGAPYTLADLQAVWQSRSIAVTNGGPVGGFGDFGTTAVEVRLTKDGDTMTLSVLVYGDSEAAGSDWEMVPGQAPTAKAGHNPPEHVSAWWNENIVVVVHSTSGDIGGKALAGFLDLGG